jgi:hypothetical protein
MHIITSQTGKYVTTCRFCAQPIAETPPLDVPPTGEPGRKVEAIMKIMVKHLQKNHIEEFMQGLAFNQDFPAFLILSAFRFEDPSINARLETIRAGIFALVRKNTLTDASLQHVVATFGLDPDDAAKVLQGMLAVRDACCEIGQHAAKLPTVPAVISA